MKLKIYTIVIISLVLFSCAKNNRIRYAREPFVKIAIKHKAQKLIITSTNNYVLHSTNGQLKLSKRDTLYIYRNKYHPRVYINNKKKIKKIYFNIKIKPYGGVLKVNGKAYRGELWILPDVDNLLLLVNYLPIEDYLKGVVPSEIGHLSLEKIEASKAQAIAARTYTISHLKKHYDMGYDMECTVADQVYKGIGMEDNITNRAIYETRGIVALYNNKPIDAKYSSTCGGITANNEDEWGGKPAPYLRSVKDSGGCLWWHYYYCDKSKHFRWKHVFYEKDFYSLLSKNMSVKKNKKIKIINIRITKVDKSGRVKELRLIDSNKKIYKLYGLDIRRIFKGVNAPGQILRSRYFSLKKRFNIILINGRGFGHGVGMCQYGAMGMAAKGKNYKTILKHYYKGIELKRIY